MCVSIAELEVRFNLSRGTIWDIVHKRLGYRKDLLQLGSPSTD
jgi:hypothetical protein